MPRNAWAYALEQLGAARSPAGRCARLSAEGYCHAISGSQIRLLSGILSTHLPCLLAPSCCPARIWRRRRRPAGAYPASLDDAETERILTTLLELGVNTFVCLQVGAEGECLPSWIAYSALPCKHASWVHAVKKQAQEPLLQYLRNACACSVGGCSLPSATHQLPVLWQAEFSLHTPQAAWRAGQGLRPYIKDAQKLLIRARETGSRRILQARAIGCLSLQGGRSLQGAACLQGMLQRQHLGRLPLICHWVQDELDFLHLPIIDGSVTSDVALSRLADDCCTRILRGERLYVHW